MYNLYDYLAWRGDLSIDVSPMNEVDFAILSALVYTPFEHAAAANISGLTLRQLHERFPEDLEVRQLLGDFDEHVNALWEPLAASVRFGDARLRRFSCVTEDNEIDEKDKQFCGATFSFAGDEIPGQSANASVPEETAVVCFRGTDSTMIGWRENFTLGYEDTVPAQRDALAYLNDALDQFPRVYVCGHSKGGNLAMYAASQCARPERILGVYNFDGPGVSDAVLATPGWAAMRSKVHTLVPQSSVIGMLLGAGEPRQVVVADGVSVGQHDPFLWHIERTAFVRAEGLTASAAIIDRGIDEYMASTPEEGRKNFVYGLFKLVKVSGARTTEELAPMLMKSLPGKLLASAGSKAEDVFTEEERVAIREFTACLKRAGADKLGESLLDKLPSWLRGDRAEKDADAAPAEAPAGEAPNEA